MRHNMIKGVLALVCLALVSMPVTAQKPFNCAAADIQLGSYSAKPGDWVGVYGSLQNCSPGKQRYTVEISARSACGVETIIAYYRSAFDPGENKLYSIVYIIAPNTCPGESTVTVNVSDGDALLTSASTILTVR